jgi:hypothetical protein
VPVPVPVPVLVVVPVSVVVVVVVFVSVPVPVPVPVSVLVLVVLEDPAEPVVGLEPPDPVYVGMDASPVGDSLIASFALTQPDFAVIAAGHATCLKVIVGLLAFWNQSKRQ